MSGGQSANYGIDLFTFVALCYVITTQEKFYYCNNIELCHRNFVVVS